MGQAKQRGTKEERTKKAQLIQSEYTADEIELGKIAVSATGCSLASAIKALREVRKENDEKYGKMGYVRAGDLALGQPVFIKQSSDDENCV
jgi:hypothetical protein